MRRRSSHNLAPWRERGPRSARGAAVTAGHVARPRVVDKGREDDTAVLAPARSREGLTRAVVRRSLAGGRSERGSGAVACHESCTSAWSCLRCARRPGAAPVADSAVIALMRWAIRTDAVLVSDRAIDLVNVPIRRPDIYPTRAFAVIEHVAGEHGPSPVQVSPCFHIITNRLTQYLPPTHLLRSWYWLHNLEHLSTGKSRTGIAKVIRFRLPRPVHFSAAVDTAIGAVGNRRLGVPRG